MYREVWIKTFYAQINIYRWNINVQRICTAGSNEQKRVHKIESTSEIWLDNFR